MDRQGLWACVARRIWIGLAVFVAACGGGGGGGGGSDGALKLNVDTARLSLQAMTGTAAGTGQALIKASITGGSGNEDLFFGAETTGPGILSPLQATLDSSARTGTIQVAPDTSLAPGTYSGSLRLLVCLDALCGSQVSGSPFTLAYTVTITPRLSASVTALDFAAPETVAATAQGFDVDLPAGATAATASVDYGAGPAGWLQVTAAGTRYTVQPGSQLTAGSYAATLVLDVGDPAQTVSLPVRLTVSAGLAVPANAALTVTSETAASATRGSLAVTTAPGVQLAGWTARSTVPWLVLDTAAGAPGASIAWHIDTAAFDALANNASHSGTIVVEAGPGLAPATVTFALGKQLAELRGLDGAALVAGEAGELLLYGERFEQFGATPAQRVSIAGVTPTTVTRQGSGLLSVQVPALAAGRHAVTLSTAGGFATRVFQLDVPPARDYPAFSAAMVQSTSGIKRAMVWDAVTGTAFVHNQSSDALMRFQVVGGASPAITSSSRSIPGLVGIAMSPDRHAVLALTASGTLLEIDPTDLSIRRSTETGVAATSEMAGLPLMVSGDGQAWFSGGDFRVLTRHDLILGSTAAASIADGSPLGSPWGLVSGNGRQWLAVAGSGFPGSSRIVARDSADGALNRLASRPAPDFFNRAGSNRSGTRWVLDNDVLRDGALNVLGRLVPPTGWTATQSAISRDGSRTYLFTRDALHVNSRIYVFDTAAAAGPNVAYPVLGYLEPLLNPSCSNEIQNADCDSFGTRMVLSDDDRTILVVGDRSFEAVPVSQPLRGQSAQAPAAALKLLRSPAAK